MQIQISGFCWKIPKKHWNHFHTWQLLARAGGVLGPAESGSQEPVIKCSDVGQLLNSWSPEISHSEIMYTMGILA